MKAIVNRSGQYWPAKSSPSMVRPHLRKWSRRPSFSLSKSVCRYFPVYLVSLWPCLFSGAIIERLNKGVVGPSLKLTRTHALSCWTVWRQNSQLYFSFYLQFSFVSTIVQIIKRAALPVCSAVVPNNHEIHPATSRLQLPSPDFRRRISDCTTVD